MWYVYIIRSFAFPEQEYTGSSADLKQRLRERNDGKSIHTDKYRPWNLKTNIAFSDGQKADKFETFLKSGNGRMFVIKYF
jgi:predicted GIY-YIG superfamily endonuclease